MHFRRAEKNDIPQIETIYRQAIAYLAANHIDQWQNGYPNAASAEADIDAGYSYLFENTDGIIATFAFVTEPEPTYKVIYQGAWKNDGTYATIHRLAVLESESGIIHLADGCERLAYEKLV